MHGPFSCPLFRNFPPVAVCSIPTPIFTNVFGPLHNRDRVPLNLQYFPSRKGTVRRSDGILLAEFSCMVWICQHCGAPFVDSPYRVKSEESGVVFLDLIVCHGCYVQARELGLRTEEIGVRYRSPQKPQPPKKKADIAAMNSRATGSRGVEASEGHVSDQCYVLTFCCRDC